MEFKDSSEADQVYRDWVDSGCTDQSLATEFWKLVGTSEFYHARSILSDADKEDAMDIVSVCVLNIFKPRGTQKVRKTASGYLHKSVKNACIAWGKAARRDRERDGIFHQTMSNSDGRTCFGEFEYSRIQKWLDSLDEKQRQIILMHYEENLTYDKMAAKLGISVHLTGRRIRRLHEELRKWWTRSKVSPDD